MLVCNHTGELNKHLGKVYPNSHEQNMSTCFTAYYTISMLRYYHGDCMVFKPICYPFHTW
jgi:hypothetical protein